jgi:hypothetical protein
VGNAIWAATRSRPTLIVLICFLCAGCYLPSAPAPVDPYDGLMPAGKHPPQAAQQLPIEGRGRTLALVVSNSTEKQKQFAFIETYSKAWRDCGICQQRPDHEKKVRANYLVNAVLDKYRRHFGKVELANDFNQMLSGKYDYVALLDIAIQLPNGFDYLDAYDIKSDLLTNRIERIGSFEGQAEERNTCMGQGLPCAYDVNFRTIDAAVARFGAALDAGVH